jgi:hypothetical protein
MIPHTWTILTPSSSNENHAMLLYIMSLSSNICRNDSPCRQSHPRSFPLCRIGLLGLGDPDFQTDPLEFRGHDISERGTDRLARALFNSASLGRTLGLVPSEETSRGLQGNVPLGLG